MLSNALQAAQVTLEWVYPNDTLVSGFLLGCGPSPGSANYNLQIELGDVRIATVNGLAPAQTYYCAVRAKSITTNQISGYSNEVAATMPSPPSPAFAMSAAAGAAPLTVSFTNNTGGSATRYEWDFGDGSGSTLAAPTHVYSTPGRYTAVLTAFGPGGSVSTSRLVDVGGGNALIAAVRTAVTTVVEGAAPAVGFSYARVSGSGPLTAPVDVRFTNESVGATRWQWDFGDGNKSAEANPTYTYYRAGTYEVRLTAIGPGGTTSPPHMIRIVVGAGASGAQSGSQNLSVPSTARSPAALDCTAEGEQQEFVLGDNVLGTPDPARRGVAVAFSTSALDCGTVGRFSVYLDAKSSANKLVVGLYSDEGGHPGTLLTQGVMINPVAGTWNTVPVTPRSVTKGEVYWIALLGGQSGTVYYHTRAGSCAAETSAQSGLLSLPPAWFTGEIVGACPVAAYATSTR